LKKNLSLFRKYGLFILSLFLVVFLISCDSFSHVFITAYDDVTKDPIEGVKVSFYLTEGRTDIVFTNKYGIAGTMWSGGPMDIRITLEKTDYNNKELMVNAKEFVTSYNGETEANVDVYLVHVK
jgi:hypothetical protein